MKVRKYRIEKQVRIDKGLGFEGVTDSETEVSSYDWGIIKNLWFDLKEGLEDKIVKKEDRDFHKEYIFYFLVEFEIEDDEEGNYKDVDIFAIEK